MKPYQKIKSIQVIAVVLAVLAIHAACDHNNLALFGSPSQTQGEEKPTPTPKGSPSPSPSVSATPTPTPELPACVPQTQPFVCMPGTPTLDVIVRAAQSQLAWQPEALYVSSLVALLNKDPRVCATGGGVLPSDEISVKYRATNSSSENFDVYSASGEPQAIPAGPATPNGPANICHPARF